MTTFPSSLSSNDNIPGFSEYNLTCTVKMKSIYFMYSDNQKTREQKDDIIAILKRFDVNTKQICLLVTQQSTI